MSRSEIVKERPIQTKAFDSVTKLLETRGECLVKMFCGTGKSRVMKRLIMEQKKSLSIIVFPSLALIRQFTSDYLCDMKTTREYGLLNVSSEELADITSTTDPVQIHHFLNNPKTKKQKKIICVTYQSLDVLLSSIGDTKIGIACFDEAHRTTSPEAKELVYGDEYRAKYEKRVFFTATPVNANGITMFDRERDEMGTHGDCGPLACEYTYLQGLRDAILSLFELRIDLYTQDTVANMYESIARAIMTTGNTRVLTFHTDAAAESDSETSVLRFVDKAKFVEAFHAVCAKEFPDKVGKFTVSNITFTAITAETKNKDAILSAFETCSDDEIYIVASCRTIGEGVDTKKANMCVFVDPKSSVISIIQNIGRICRKITGSERQPATILIPVCIGWKKYREAGDDPEVQDKLIREQLNDRENGDYNAIMNIVAALKQEDPELYELCLRYPSKFTEAERKHALEEQGFRVLDDESDEADDEEDTEPNVLSSEDIDELVEHGARVEIHTSNVDVPIVYRGFDDEDADEDADEDERPIERFYEVDEENEYGEMETRYHRIVPMNGHEDEESRNRRLNPPKATNRPRMKFHTNDEIKLLWKLGDVALGEQFGSAVLECIVERLDNDELWKEKHQKMCLHIDKTGKAPSQTAKDPEEKTLGQWVSNQKTDYDPRGPEFSKNGMKNKERWQIWTETLANPKYRAALDQDQAWKNSHQNMCLHIDKTGKAPSERAKDPEEKTLGKWVSHQKTDYDPRGPDFSKKGMKNKDRWQIWTETLANPKYRAALVLDPDQDWKNDCQKMCLHIDKTGKAPSQTAKDPEEKTLGSWVSNQKTDYDTRGSEFSKKGMKNKERWQIWTDSIQKYPCLKKRGQEETESIKSPSPSPSPFPSPSPPPSSKPKKFIIKKKSHLIPNPSLECSAPETNPSTTSSKRVITDSPYKLTGRAWSSQKSTTTHEKLRSNPAEWHAYHAARDISFQGYADQSQIPRNRVIAHLANKRKHRLRILDLGCGRNNIAQHYADEKKFTIQGYDHVAEEGSGALVGNIADLAAQEEDESADICIYSQSLMGSDWREYLTEGHRMLRYNGEFIISEHIKLLDDVRVELGRLGCKVESVNADAGEAAAEAEDADDKVAKWFVLVARKV